MNTESYADYLQSDGWKERRQGALERARFACQVCNSRDSLQVHHRTYLRVGHEDNEDLTVLCDDCHGLFHEKLPQPPDMMPEPAMLSVEEKKRREIEADRRLAGLYASDPRGAAMAEILREIVSAMEGQRAAMMEIESASASGGDAMPGHIKMRDCSRKLVAAQKRRRVESARLVALGASQS